MNPYIFDCECSVCGGPGACRPNDIAAAWSGGVQHADPRACAMYLEEKARKLAKKEAELTAQESAA